MSKKIPIITFIYFVFFSCACNHKGVVVEGDSAAEKTIPDTGFSVINLDTLQGIEEFFDLTKFEDLNQFIDEEIRVTLLFSKGVNSEYVELGEFSSDKNKMLDKNIPDWIVDRIYSNFSGHPEISDFEPTMDSIFECETVKQFGAFVDQGVNGKILSRTIEHLIHVGEMEDSEPNYIVKLSTDLKKWKRIEERSQRIVITWKSTTTDDACIAAFHFVKKHGRFYLVLMDFESYNCSA